MTLQTEFFSTEISDLLKQIIFVKSFNSMLILKRSIHFLPFPISFRFLDFPISFRIGNIICCHLTIHADS